MKRLALTALALATTALSGAAFADDYYNQGARQSGYQSSNAYGNSNGVRYDNARVLSVDPIIDDNYSQSRRECWTVPARRNARLGNRSYNSHYGSSYGNNYSNNYSNQYNYNDNYRGRNNGIGNNTGAVLGGIIGAALGNQVGDGDGRRAATAVGAVLGYAIARDVQNNGGSNYGYSNNRYETRGDQYGNGYYTEPNGQLRCRMVNDDQYGYGYQDNRYDDDDGDRAYRSGRDRYVNERYQDRYNHDRYDNRYDDARVTGYRVTFEYQGKTYTTVTDYHPGNDIRVRVNVEADRNEIGYSDRNYRDNRYARY